MSVHELSNHHFAATIAITCSQSAAWSALTDVATWPQWDTLLKSAQINGPFAVGATGVLVPRVGLGVSFSISKLDVGHSYEFQVKLPIGEMVIERRLQVEGSTVHFTDDIAFTGPAKQLLGLTIGRIFRKLLPRVMSNAKEFIEAR